MKKFSVLMLDGEGIISLFVARCLGQIQGLRLHVLSRDKWAPLHFSRYHSTFQVSSEEDDERRLVNIAKAIKQTQSDIILPVGEPAVQFVSTQHASLMKLTSTTPVPTVNIFETMVNKWLSIDFLTKHDIPCPCTVLYTNDENFKQSLNQLSFPVLLKPTRGKGGGKGIEFFDDLDSLLQTLEKNEGFVNQYVVQTFIDGYDIDCSVLCQDGKILAYTVQKSLPFPGRRFAPPAGIEFVQDEQTFDVVNRWASVTKWSGVAHLDLRYDKRERQTKIIEVNARYWASLPGSLVAGVNFPYLACLAGMGIPFARPDYDLKKFVSGNAATKSVIRRLIGRNKTDLTFEETSWRFAATDPLAEIFKLGKLFW